MKTTEAQKIYIHKHQVFHYKKLKFKALNILTIALHVEPLHYHI